MPSIGAPKIRKAVLAQDGHSLAEQALYTVLWNAGKPEADPNGARIVRMGYAELAAKARLTRNNTKENLLRLLQKLALEITVGHDSDTSQARTYRIYSFSQILDRRREAGLVFYKRDRGGVQFCTRTGELLTRKTKGTGPTPGPAPFSGIGSYPLSDDGLNTSVGTAPLPSKGPASMPTEGPLNREESLANTLEKKQSNTQQQTATFSHDDLRIVTEALNRYGWVDQAAAVQLLRDCRQIRPDATVDEIGFFVAAKLNAVTRNPRILNPVGLVLATVPQAFVGPSFEQFRRRREQEMRLAREEAERKEQETRELEEWLNAERARLQAIMGDERRPKEERDRAGQRLKHFGLA